jgi:hypothetical protein
LWRHSFTGHWITMNNGFDSEPEEEEEKKKKKKKKKKR